MDWNMLTVAMSDPASSSSKVPSKSRWIETEWAAYPRRHGVRFQSTFQIKMDWNGRLASGRVEAVPLPKYLPNQDGLKPIDGRFYNSFGCSFQSTFQIKMDWNPEHVRGLQKGCWASKVPSKSRWIETATVALMTGSLSMLPKYLPNQDGLKRSKNKDTSLVELFFQSTFQIKMDWNR